MKKRFNILIFLLALFLPIIVNAEPDETTTYYTLNYNLNGGINNTNNPSEYNEESTIILSNPTRKGYVFGGWYSESNYQTQITEIQEGSTGDKDLYALWLKSSYKINYKANGGSGKMSATTCKANKDCTLRSRAFKRTGYTFIEWNTKKDGSGIAYSNKQVVKNITTGSSITLYAIWRPIVYKVKLVGNGSSDGPMEIIECTYGKNCKLPSNIYTRVGYKYNGWNTKSNGKGKNYKNNQTVKNLASSAKTVTLYAKWSKIKYYITYKLNGGKNSSKNPKSFYVTTSTISLKNPTRKGYNFLGWYLESDFVTRLTNIPKGSTGGKTLYAKWIKSEYKVSFSANGGSGKMKTITCKINKNCTLTKNGFSRKGYSFAGWNTKADGTGTSYSNKGVINQEVATDIKLYAQWKLKNYSITYKLNGGVNNSENPSTYDYTKSVSLKKPTRDGYGFAGWYSDSKFKKKVSSISKGSTGNKTLYAKWSKSVLSVNSRNVNVEYGSNSVVEVKLSKKGTVNYFIEDENVVAVRSEKNSDYKTSLYLYSRGVGSAKITITNSVDNSVIVINATVVAGQNNPDVWYRVVYEIDNDEKICDCYNPDETFISSYTSSVINGARYGYLPCASKEGFVFNGWYTERNGQGTKINETTVVNVTENVTLYPYWVVKGATDLDKAYDHVYPVITTKETNISVNSHTEIEDAIINNIVYSDDRDLNPKMEYELSYNSGHSVGVEVKVTDFNNNISYKWFNITVDGEKRMSDGSWITYEEFKVLKARSREICTEHGFFSEDYECYYLEELKYYFSISNYSGYFNIDIYENGHCEYDPYSKPTYSPYWCNDGQNDVAYSIMPNGYKEGEREVLAMIIGYLDDVKTQTGYDLQELIW